MKHLLFLLISLVAFSIQVDANNLLTRSQAWTILQDSLKLNEKGYSCVYASTETVRANSTIRRIINDIESPNFDGWFFFVDDAPYQSWSHPCRYAFVNVENGDVCIYNETFPPVLDKLECIKEYVLPTNLNPISMFSYNQASGNSQLYSAKHDYAIIINGGMDKDSNHIRYWNDCAFIFSTLKNKYGYTSDHIYVLMSDGTDPSLDRRKLDGTYDSSPLDLDGDGMADIKYSATRNNLSNVFDSLAVRMGAEDNLFVYTMDHGALLNGTPILCLWGEYITAPELSQQFNKLRCNKINVCMGQCNSGGFINYIKRDNMVVSTACSGTENSFSTSNYLYDEFVYHWTAAVNGNYPNGGLAKADKNSDNKISMKEAFDYVCSNDSKNETPQFYDGPQGQANELNLSRVCNLKIDGQSVVCDSAYYYINDLPEWYDVVWTYVEPNNSYYPQTIQNYPGHNYCMITNKNKCSYNGTLSADIYDGSKIVAKASKPVSSSTTYFYGTYAQESCTYHSAVHPSIPTTVLSTSNPMFVQQGCMVRIKSNMLVNREVKHSGVVPEVFYYGGKDQIEFSLPLNSGGIPFHIFITGDGDCLSTDLLFFAVPDNGNIKNSKSLRISLQGNEAATVNIIDQNLENVKCANMSNEKMPYDIQVYSGISGDRLLEDSFCGNTYNINISDWKKGLYVIRVSSGDTVLTSKLTLKNN